MSGIPPKLAARLIVAKCDLNRQRAKHIAALVREVDGVDYLECVCGHTVVLAEAVIVDAEPDVELIRVGGSVKARIKERMSVVCKDCAERYGGTWKYVKEFMESQRREKGGDVEQVGGNGSDNAKEALR